MIRLLTAPALFVSAVALVQAQPVPEAAKGPVLYFPTRAGATATYQSPTGPFVLVVTHAETKDGVTVATLAKGQSADRVAPHVKVEVSGRGVFQTHSYAASAGGDEGQPRDFRWSPFSTPLCLLKLPTTPGEKWDALDSHQGREVCVAGRAERVRVPAGDFTAIPIEVVPEMGRGEKTWYAPEVGPVKWTTSKGEVVLKSFTPGKR